MALLRTAVCVTPAPHRSPTAVKAAELAPGRSQTCSTGPTRGQTVTLNVLAVNSRAEGLCRRLGFVQADRTRWHAPR